MGARESEMGKPSGSDRVAVMLVAKPAADNPRGAVSELPGLTPGGGQFGHPHPRRVADNPAAGAGSTTMSLEAIATKLDQGIAELRAGTLQESTLAAIREELRSARNARQDLLYVQAAGTALDTQVIGMRMVTDGELSDGADDPDEWPYQTVLDAIRDGWRIIEFPNLALLLDESRTYAYGAEFVLEKIRSA